MKNWYQSKTIWVNVLTLVVMILSSLAQWQELAAYAPTLLAVVSTINIVLRFLTDKSIK